MLINVKPESKRAVNLIRAVREIGAILPGDRIKMIGETTRGDLKSPSGGRGYESPKPATYLGAIEEGDIQVDYIQLHIFELFDGLQVILEAPSLNRSLVG